MAPVTNELFLLSCINHAVNGKIDFKTVAQECGMNTSGAASVRFRRFKQKHDTSLLNATASRVAVQDGEGDDEGSEAPDKKPSPKKKATPKKRKLEEEHEVAVKAEPEDDEQV